MKRLFIFSAIAISLFFMFAMNTHPSLITFSDATSGATTFNTFAIGSNMTNIQKPGLRGTMPINADLRVDSLNKAQDSLELGFELDSFSDAITYNRDLWSHDFKKEVLDLMIK